MEVTAMTEPQGIESITEADVAAFAQKLESWAEELSPKEQTLLRRLVARAVGIEDADQDVQGYAISTGGWLTPGLFHWWLLHPESRPWWVPAPRQPVSGGTSTPRV
jgi:hypothetical protein